MNPKHPSFTDLLARVRSCRACADLPCGPRPIVQADPGARIPLAGQAPGSRVHETGIPWNDRSGDRLRLWLSVDHALFYSPLFAIIPMGLCYPGPGPYGDAPPRPGCAPLWHRALCDARPHIELTLLIGRYAQNAYLAGKTKTLPLKSAVRSGANYGVFWPLPHPSGRNNRGLAHNPWFITDILQKLKTRVHDIITGA